MIKAVIIDDEPSAVNTLKLMLERYIPEIKMIKSTNDPEEGLHLIKTFQPQLLFLDIQMPQMNGFRLLRKIPFINFNIIFTTAYDQYAIEAIRFSALDYLLKPIDAEDLRQAVDKYMIKEVITLGQQALYSNLIDNLNAEDKSDFKLALSTSDGIYFFNPEEIIRIEGESNYSKFFFTDRKNLLTSKTLKDYEELLNDHGFVRTHKSHLINVKHVVNYTSDGILTMTDYSRVEVSRRRKEEVMDALRVR